MKFCFCCCFLKCSLRNGFDIEKLWGKRGGRATTRLQKLRKFAKPHIHFFDVLVNYAHILLHNFRQQQTVVHQSQYMHLSTLFEIFNFCPKIQLWFTDKIIHFWGVKNSWKYCGFGLFRCWQLWFHEKYYQKIFWWKLVKMLGLQRWVLTQRLGRC